VSFVLSSLGFAVLLGWVLGRANRKAAEWCVRTVGLLVGARHVASTEITKLDKPPEKPADKPAADKPADKSADKAADKAVDKAATAVPKSPAGGLAAAGRAAGIAEEEIELLAALDAVRKAMTGMRDVTKEINVDKWSATEVSKKLHAAQKDVEHAKELAKRPPPPDPKKESAAAKPAAKPTVAATAGNVINVQSAAGKLKSHKAPEKKDGLLSHFANKSKPQAPAAAPAAADIEAAGPPPGAAGSSGLINHFIRANRPPVAALYAQL